MVMMIGKMPSTVPSFHEHFNIAGASVIPYRCAPCRAVGFWPGLQREGIPAPVPTAMSRATARSRQLAGCLTQQEDVLIPKSSALLGLESKLSVVKSPFIFLFFLNTPWGFSSENMTNKRQKLCPRLYNAEKWIWGLKCLKMTCVIDQNIDFRATS